MIDDIKHFHVCGGSGSGAAGFNDARPELGAIKGRMVCLGGVDVDPLACADFRRLTGVAQTCRDMFSLGQYQAFHGQLPPPGWVEMGAQDVRAAAAIGQVMGQTIMLARSGETFALGSTPIWVRPVAVAVSVDQAV